jgi:hypothetical protein
MPHQSYSPIAVASPCLAPEAGFDIARFVFDASPVVHFRSSSSFVPNGTFCATFSRNAQHHSF